MANSQLSSFKSDGGRGPLLEALIRTQRKNEDALSFPRLGELGAALAGLCRELGSPLVWPVGAAAERLAGAAMLCSEGAIRVRGWSQGVELDEVLVVALAEETPISLVKAAQNARALGAVEVHAATLDVVGLDSPELGQIFESRSILRAQPKAPPLAVVS